MPKNRFFTDQSLQLGTLALSAEESHHMKVMRLSPGSPLELVNGKGELAQATLLAMGRSEAQAKVTQVEQTAPPYSPCLIQAFPRHAHLNTLIEKSVELGVGTIWLFPGMRSEKISLSEEGQKRLNGIAIAAMKQCGRLYLPAFSVRPPLVEWQSLPAHTFYGSLHIHASPLYALLPSLDSKAVPYFVIGPEAGLSPEEIAHLERLGAQGISLHPSTLRTETAGPFAIGLAIHLRM